jgi:CRISPR-associated endoribonuclease Cas6
MRITVSYLLADKHLPLDYRRGFAALVKEALKRSNSELFTRYYGTLHVLKPFTFSVYFPGLVGQAGERFDVGDRAILNFSTSSYELGTHVYNGLLAFSTFPLFDNNLKLVHIQLGRTLTLDQEVVTFRTLAPVLVNNKGSADWYLLPDQEGFEEGLDFAVKEIAGTFLGIEDVAIEFEPISIRRKVVRHYNMDMQGFVGIFELRGHPDVLNLIYQIGLGVRRSQGFGMLEVVL